MIENEPVSTPPVAPPSPELPMSGLPSAEEKQWAMFAHLSALAGAVLSTPFGGFGTFIGPLVIWLIKKDTMPFAANQAKEALNFNITVSAIFMMLLMGAVITFGIGLLLTVPMMLVVGIAALVFTIIAAVKASEGVEYRYPVTVRIIK